VLFLYLAVCLGRLHTAPKQTLTRTRCDRLSLIPTSTEGCLPLQYVD
jgi:hypothetical protein